MMNSSVKRGDYDSDDASDSDPFASNDDGTANSDKDILYYPCLFYSLPMQRFVIL